MIFCVLFGFFSGACITLSPAIIVSITPDMSLLGTRMGMLVVPNALGVLIGNPIAGAILGNHDAVLKGAAGARWTGLQAFTGAIVGASVVFAVGTRVSKAGLSLRKKC